MPWINLFNQFLQVYPQSKYTYTCWPYAGRNDKYVSICAWTYRTEYSALIRCGWCMWTIMSLRGFCWFGWTKDFPISGPNWKTNCVREINREIVLISAGLSFLKTYSFYLFCALHLLEKGKKLEFLRLNAMLLTFVRLKKCLIRTIFHADVRYTMCRICTSIFHFPFPAYSIRPANHYQCCAFNLMKFEQNMITYEIPS